MLVTLTFRSPLLVYRWGNGGQKRSTMPLPTKYATCMLSLHSLSLLTLSSGALHVPTVEALLAPVVVAMGNTVGRIELLAWLKAAIPRIPAGEVRPSCMG